MSTFNQLDLQTLGSQPAMPKNLPDHCLGGVSSTQMEMTGLQDTTGIYGGTFH
jgi:hypothetical protein